MQRRQGDGIVISCDFCGADWDQVLPMLEGHRGSVLCLPCLEKALSEQAPGADEFTCTMCLRPGLGGDVRRWRSPSHPQAVVCADCVQQAARAFSKDPDVDWTLERWRRRRES